VKGRRGRRRRQLP